MIPHFSAVSTPPTTASMHQQSLMYTNQNQTGIQAAHQQPQPFVYQPQEGITFQVLIFCFNVGLPSVIDFGLKPLEIPPSV